MKRKLLSIGFVAAFALGLAAFTGTQTGIVGRVVPQDAVDLVWAISGTDSLKTNVTSGAFSLPAKAGTYKVIVDAKDPYQDVTFENVEVRDGEATDLGEITLQQ